MSTTPTEELRVLIKAREGIVAVRTHEVERVMDALFEIASEEGSPKTLLTWKAGEGVKEVKLLSKIVAGRPIQEVGSIDVEQFKDDPYGIYGTPPGAIKAAREYGKLTEEAAAAGKKLVQPLEAGGVLVFAAHNFHHYLVDPGVQQAMIDTAYAFLRERRVLVLIGPVFNLPVELSKCVTIMDWPLPKPEEIREIVDERVSMVLASGRYEVDLNGDEQLLVRALQGMTATEVRHALNVVITTHKRIAASPEVLKLVNDRKAGVVKATRALEFFETNEDMSHVGGLENLKRYCREVAAVYSDKAREFGAVPPRGVLLVGPPGTGKSLTSKCIASLFGMPLLRMDAGSLFSSLVGSSEENVRQALRVAEAVAPCVLWADEIEKSMGGGGGELDGGTSSRVFATFLTWMQERARKAGIFVVMTANAVGKIDPALFQRVDRFLVDLPDIEARAEVFAIHLAKNGRGDWEGMGIDIPYLASITDGYSPREIEEVVLSSVRKAYLRIVEEGYDGDVTTDILAEAIQETVPVSQTMARELLAMRSWKIPLAGKPSTYVPPAQLEGAADNGFVND